MFDLPAFLAGMRNEKALSAVEMEWGGLECGWSGNVDAESSLDNAMRC